MDIDEVFFGTLILCLIGVLGLAFVDSMQPPIQIDSNEVCDYVNEKVSVTLHVIEQVDSGTELDFLMPILIPHTMSTGKTTTTYFTTIFVPIFDNYIVYSTKEGVLLAVDGDVVFSENSTVNVVGHVRKEKNNERYAIEVI